MGQRRLQQLLHDTGRQEAGPMKSDVALWTAAVGPKEATDVVCGVGGRAGVTREAIMESIYADRGGQTAL